MSHIFNGDGMRPDPEQFKAITELKKPSHRVELQKIIGMCNYIREFISNMATYHSNKSIKRVSEERHTVGMEKEA